MTTSPQPRTFDDLLSALIGLVLGLLLMGAGFWVRSRQQHEQATLMETQGIVVDSVSRQERDSSDNSQKTTYAPVIEFQVRDKPLRFIGPYESYRISHGQQVVVRYDSDQPATTARLVDPLSGLAAWALFGMGGLGLLASLKSLGNKLLG